MRLKSCLAILAGMLSLSGLSFAASDVPAQCPNVNLIKAAGLRGARAVDPGVWIVYNQGHFSTDFDWTLNIGFIEAKTMGKAYAQGKKLLSALSGEPTPAVHSGLFGCVYDLDEHHFAVALLDDGKMPPDDLLRLFQK